MNPMQIIFIVVAAATLGAGLMVVSARNLVHSALWLVVALFGVAIVYVLLEAGFLAVVQVVIYIGAIAILMIFAIMLTRRIAQDSGPRFNEDWSWAAAIALVMFVALVWILFSWSGIGAPSAPALSESADPLRDLGVALVSPDGFVLAFELASVLLLAALIGAIYVAWDRKS
ncbi:MAG: NADH-quinone oxidoreductase subunit J [Anaerolineales bacterium]|nr:NADH-quinone oxidoreductase subunit J [Anaerolineales bacterium]